MTVDQVIQKHRAKGTFISIDKVQTFVLEEGRGEPVVFFHGVPASSFLYRKLVPEIAKRGMRGIAFDLPGLGLADRPDDFEYHWSSLANYSAKVVDEIGLKKMHIVVHDIGGPIGFLMAAAMPHRIKSITILNTIIDVDVFQRPWAMEPFALPVIGELWFSVMNRPMSYFMFSMLGIKNIESIPKEEIFAYADLLRGSDNGKAFLKIMRSFERTREVKQQCYHALQNVPYVIDVIWGMDDPALPYDRYALPILKAAGLQEAHKLPGKHFFQEEYYSEIADRIANTVLMAG